MKLLSPTRDVQSPQAIYSSQESQALDPITDLVILHLEHHFYQLGFQYYIYTYLVGLEFRASCLVGRCFTT
jgi:hypothetical protein